MLRVLNPPSNGSCEPGAAVPKFRALGVQYSLCAAYWRLARITQNRCDAETKADVRGDISVFWIGDVKDAKELDALER